MSRLDSDADDLELRLQTWRPAAADSSRRDRMLYAAGRASVMPQSGTRRPALALAALLAVACAGLGAAWQIERGRSDRLESRITQLTAALDPPRDGPHPVITRTSPEPPVRSTPPEPSSYLALMARFESGRMRLEPAHRDMEMPVPNQTEDPTSRPGEPLRVRGWRDSSLVL